MFSLESYKAAIDTGAVARRSDRGVLAVAGADRASWLQGLLTNDVESLKDGESRYAAYLTPQGRMIADMRVFETGRSLLVDLVATLADTVTARWSQFVFSEDVQISNDSASTVEIGVYGPASARVVAEAVAGEDIGEAGRIEAGLRSLPLYANRAWERDGQELRVLVSDDIGVRGFDLVVSSKIKDDVVGWLHGAGAVAVGAAAAEVCRVESGRPLFGMDMTEDTIPLEAGIEDRAISLTKGCYVGQEVIIRVLHRGHGRVVRKLVGLVFQPGTVVPARDEKIAAADRDIGAITSAVASPALGRPIALGYVHRDFVDPGTVVTVDGQVATVASLPFVRSENAVDRVAAE